MKSAFLLSSIGKVAFVVACLTIAPVSHCADNSAGEEKSMKNIRVAGVQMLVSRNLEENLPKVLDHIRKTDAQFILFPEMSLTGYHGDFSQTAAEGAWDKISRACVESEVTAFIGTGCKEGDATYIQTRVFTEEGEVLGTHEKMVPTSGDRNFCVPGEELRLFKHHGISFGCLICNDLWVTPGCGPYPDPRLAYQLGQKGANILFHAIHSGSSDVHIPYHESNLALRAMESKFYIVTANAADPKGPVNARTGIVSPGGEWIVEVPREGEHTYVYDLVIELE